MRSRRSSIATTTRSPGSCDDAWSGGWPDELASETFLRAFAARERYDRSHADARPWLYGIAANLLRSHRRAEERRLRAYARAASPGSDPAAFDDVDARLDATARRGAIAAALSALVEVVVARPIPDPRVVPNEMAKRPGVTPLRFRNWLRAGHAAGHPLLAGHVHGSRWDFSQPDAERLIAEFQSSGGQRSVPGTRSVSSSDVQSRAESAIREQLARRLDCKLRTRTIALGTSASVQVDAVSDDALPLCPFLSVVYISIAKFIHECNHPVLCDDSRR